VLAVTHRPRPLAHLAGARWCILHRGATECARSLMLAAHHTRVEQRRVTPDQILAARETAQGNLRIPFVAVTSAMSPPPPSDIDAPVSSPPPRDGSATTRALSLPDANLARVARPSKIPDLCHLGLPSHLREALSACSRCFDLDS
jgi:hypothetical protein